MENELKKGLFYSFVGKYSNIVVFFIINSILARLISPEEYGILAIIMAFITFFSNLLEMGWGAAIIQKEKISEKFICSVFYVNVALSFLTGIIFYLFSYYFISNYYNNQIYKILGEYLFFYLLILGLGIVPKALLSRQKKFKEIAYISLISNIISGIVGIVLAFKGFSYYALIFQGIILNFLIFVLSWKISELKITLSFSIKEIKSMFNYSSYTFLFNSVNFFSRNLDNILIGKYMGNYSLGIYDKAYKLMLYPLSILTNVISPVLHPILARYQDNKEKMYYEYMKIVKILACLGVLISVILFFSAKEIILILYGKNWLQVIPIFKILSISTAIQIVLSSSGTVFLASGKSNKLFFTGIISSTLMVSAIITGLKYNNLNYIGFMLFFAFLGNFFIGYYILIKKVLKRSFILFLKEFLASIYILMVLIIGNYIYFLNIEIKNIFISFLIKGALNFICFLISVRFIYFKNKKIKDIIFLLKQFK